MSLDSIFFVLKRSVSNIFHNIVLSFASISILIACLVIFGVTLMLSENITYFIEGVGSETKVVVRLEEDLEEEQIKAYGEALAKIDNIVKEDGNGKTGIIFESKEQALENYKNTFTDASPEINETLDAEIFRNAYIFEVEDLSKLDQTIYEVEKIEGAAKIQLQRDIVDKLENIKGVLAFLFTAIMVFLFILSVFVITNSVKASVYARKNEIAIMKYVGATDFFIRLPFFFEGLIIGVFSGIISNIILVYLYNSVISPVLAEIEIITPVNISSGHSYLTLVFILCGAAVGVLGSVLPVKKYLKV